MLVKKKLIVLLSMVSLFTITAKCAYASNGFDEYTNANVHSCLGKTIDVVRAKKYSDFSTCNVLDEEYYNNLRVIRNNYYHYAGTEFYSGNSSEKVQYDINSNYSYSTSLDGVNVKGFTLGAKNRFTIGAGTSYKDYYSSSFVEVVGKYDQAKYYIPNALSPLKKVEFSNHLTDDFVEALNQLSLERISYASFFNAYGTHVVTNYVSGDRIYCDGYMLSNDKVISNQFESDFTQKISAKILDVSASNDTSFNFFEEYELSTNRSECGYKVSCESGKLYTASSYGDIVNCISEWNNDIRNGNFNQNTVVEYDFDDFVPIWDILPENSPISRDKMIEEFCNYRNDNEINYDYDDCNIELNLPEETKTIRTSERTIYDKDRFNYKELFRLDDRYGIDVLKDGLKEIEFTISFEAKRIDKGYQYVYLYNQEDIDNESHDDYLYESDDFDLNKTKKEYIRTFTVPIEKIKSHDLGIVWRARGDGDDTWKLYSVKLKINYIRK